MLSIHKLLGQTLLKKPSIITNLIGSHKFLEKPFFILKYHVILVKYFKILRSISYLNNTM